MVANACAIKDMGRLARVTHSGTNISDKYVEFHYDAAGRMSDIDRYADTATIPRGPRQV
jgi:hypothetical protein